MRFDYDYVIVGGGMAADAAARRPTYGRAEDTRGSPGVSGPPCRHHRGDMHISTRAVGVRPGAVHHAEWSNRHWASGIPLAQCPFTYSA